MTIDTSTIICKSGLLMQEYTRVDKIKSRITKAIYFTPIGINGYSDLILISSPLFEINGRLVYFKSTESMKLLKQSITTSNAKYAEFGEFEMCGIMAIVEDNDFAPESIVDWINNFHANDYSIEIAGNTIHGVIHNSVAGRSTFMFNITTFAINAEIRLMNIMCGKEQNNIYISEFGIKTTNGDIRMGDDAIKVTNVTDEYTDFILPSKEMQVVVL